LQQNRHFCDIPRQAEDGRFRPGSGSSAAISLTPAPAAILAKLKPVPPGHRYVVVDGEVLLIALATGLILDVFDVI
jgi:hypothetical protein